MVTSHQFTPNFLFKNPHVNTILPNLIGRYRIQLNRQRLELMDGDFIDLDLKTGNSKTCVVIMHGLEGNSQRPYMQGMANVCIENNWDVIAVNHRGCSGEPNRLLTAYHSGKTDDLQSVLDFVLGKLDYTNIVIVGFSLSGNLVLKYGGEKGEKIDKRIKGIAAISVPCNLASSAEKLKQGFNKVYMQRFMKTLRQKAYQKLLKFPDAPFSIRDVDKAKTFHDFDEFYTSRVHGFKDAHDYWDKCSSRQFIESIRVTTLLVNAKDDPFLTEECYPIVEAEANSFITLEMPKYGGHVGFVSDFKMKRTHAELRVEAFVKDLVGR